MISHQRLILPTDSNHHGTLYAGSLLRLALEAGYATAWKHIGVEANIVLRRVLNLECIRPVPVGTVIEIQGVVMHRTPTYLVTGLVGVGLFGDQGPWMEGLLGFAQIDVAGRLDVIPGEMAPDAIPEIDPWPRLSQRMGKLLKLRMA